MNKTLAGFNSTLKPSRMKHHPKRAACCTPQEEYEAVSERSQGMCENLPGGYFQEKHPEYQPCNHGIVPLQMSHFIHRKMGGTRSKEVHNRLNIYFLCLDAHQYIDSHRKIR
jgi:hypothetical protein